MVWIGDAAGLAHSRSGKGIRPAVESGLMAAEVILAANGDYGRGALEPYAQQIEARFGPRRHEPPPEQPVSALRRSAAHWLLHRRWFVRHVVVKRWFLQMRLPPLASGREGGIPPRGTNG